MNILETHAAALMVEVKPVETDAGAGDAVAFFVMHGSDSVLVFITDDGLVAMFLDKRDGVHFAVALRGLFEVKFERLCVRQLGAEKDRFGLECVWTLLEE